MTGPLILGLSFFIGIILFVVLFIIGKSHGRDEDAVAETKALKAELKTMENKHYMLSLDVEKSRQKLAKSNAFLDGLKAKTHNVDMNQIKKDLEDE